MKLHFEGLVWQGSRRACGLVAATRAGTRGGVKSPGIARQGWEGVQFAGNPCWPTALVALSIVIGLAGVPSRPDGAGATSGSGQRSRLGCPATSGAARPVQRRPTAHAHAHSDTQTTRPKTRVHAAPRDHRRLLRDRPQHTSPFPPTAAQLGSMQSSLQSRGASRASLARKPSARQPLRVVCASDARFFVGGNWKCNGSVANVRTLVDELNTGSVPRGVEVVCAPPFIYIDYVMQHLDNARYQLAAQNCWIGGNGAFTGEISAEQLHDFGVTWVVLGHSERRSLCGETNETVAKKTSHALASGLSVIACIGETLQQRDSGSMFDVLDAQMQALVDEVKDWSNVVLAYEPVWAIGTGVVATPAQAQEVHAYLRKYCQRKLGTAVASKLRIIYGGSVNDSNCAEIGRQEDIDGFLVGGASLSGPAFVKICNAAPPAKVKV
jgi:triosephosphate isomerase